MIRSIVLAIFATIMGFSMLWLIYPMLSLGKSSVIDQFDQNDTVISTSLRAGDTFYLILGVVVFVVVGFILISRAHGVGD